MPALQARLEQSCLRRRGDQPSREDAEGNLHVLELKRDKTPREAVAQILDYGSWATTLDRESMIDLANDHLPLVP